MQASALLLALTLALVAAQCRAPTPQPLSSPTPTPTPAATPTSSASPSTESGTKVRMDFREFERVPARLEALKRGVREMKRRSQVNRNDPRGWTFQANIHGTNASNPHVAWNQCRHASSHFLTWHRGYVFYFERILREASGDPTFNLPYWDWTDLAAQGLPGAFRDPQSPLFASPRSMNQAGSTLPTSVRIRALQALTLRSFFPANGNAGFGVLGAQGTGKGALEQPPHDSVHSIISGLMGSTRTAAQDPIFWLHHCNVDRLWEVWLRRGGGRANPTSNQWLNVSFNRFYDETGNIASPLRVSQLGRTADLGYTYDRLPDAPEPMLAAATGAEIVAEASETELVAAVEKTQVTSAPVTIELGGDKVRELTGKAGAPSPAGDEKRTLLRIGGVSVDQPPGVIYEVYLNLPAAPEEADSMSPHFVGLIALFGSAPGGDELRDDAHAHHASPDATGEEFIFDVTRVLATLASAEDSDLATLKVTVVPRGPLLDGKPSKVESNATVRIERISLETAAAQPRS